MKNRKRSSRWITPVLTILLVALVLTVPLATEFTYSDRSENIDHTLTYTRNKLTWDSATNIDASTGVAQLDLFDTIYENVKSQNGKNVVAPGTEGHNIVRLKNNASGSVKFTAVLYRIKSDDKLPVKVTFSGNGLTETNTYALPKGVEKTDVLKAVSGQLGGGKVRDFDIQWLWDYEVDQVQNAIDTDFGARAAQIKADDVTVGIYIVVEDTNHYGHYIKPQPPKTGDIGVNGYMLLAAGCTVCAVLLVFVPYEKRRKKDAE